MLSKAIAQIVGISLKPAFEKGICPICGSPLEKGNVENGLVFCSLKCKKAWADYHESMGWDTNPKHSPDWPGECHCQDCKKLASAAGRFGSQEVSLAKDTMPFEEAGYHWAKATKKARKLKRWITQPPNVSTPPQNRIYRQSK